MGPGVSFVLFKYSASDQVMDGREGVQSIDGKYSYSIKVSTALSVALPKVETIHERILRKSPSKLSPPQTNQSFE